MSVLAKLPSADVARFVKFAGMIGSDHDGESLNAGRFATRFLYDHGLTWADVLKPAALPSPSQARTPPPVSPTQPWLRQVILCMDAGDIFTKWEREFLDSIANGRSLSAKQTAVLSRLYGRACDHFADDGWSS